MNVWLTHAPLTKCSEGNAKAPLGFSAESLYGPGMPSPEIIVDARGHRCPVPTLRLRRALEHAPAGAHIRLYADDPLARIDVPHFAANSGFEILDVDEDDGVLSFLIAKPA